MSAQAFKKAVESEDFDSAIAQLAPDVVLHSPVTFKPFVGKEAVSALLGVVLGVFRDFRYVGEYAGAEGTVLHFRTRVGDRDVEGIDMLRFNPDGLIDDFTVMVRPLSAVNALRDAIGAQLGALPNG